MRRQLHLPVTSPAQGSIRLDFDENGIDYYLCDFSGKVVKHFGRDEYSDLGLKKIDQL